MKREDKFTSRSGADELMFLAYAQKYWLLHSIWITERVGPAFKIWTRLCQDPEYTDKLDLWSDTGSVQLSYPGISTEIPSLLMWAILSSHHALLDLQLQLVKTRLRILVACLQSLWDMPHRPHLDGKMAARLLSVSMLVRRLDTTQWLLRMHPDITYSNYGCLYTSVWSGNYHITRLLISQSGKPLDLSEVPHAILEMAVLKGDSTLVRLLIKHNANPDLYTHRLPLDIALDRVGTSSKPISYMTISYLLLKSGANTKLCNKKYFLPAMWKFDSSINSQYFNIRSFLKISYLEVMWYNSEIFLGLAILVILGALIYYCRDDIILPVMWAVINATFIVLAMIFLAVVTVVLLCFCCCMCLYLASKGKRA
jgi:hypothetical protein